jgi:MATE family multidrug resistance protein
MKITMYIVFILFPINIVSNHFFLIYLNLSYIGAALHVSLISFLFLLSYIIYLTYFSPALKSFWPGLTKEAFHGWSEFLKLGKTYNNDKNKELTVFLKKVFPAC